MSSGLIIGLLVLVVVVGLAVYSAVGRRADGQRTFDHIVRCKDGHLFTSTWIPGFSLKAVRLGTVRYERCPVGRHWSTVSRVDESTLTADEIARARAVHDSAIP